MSYRLAINGFGRIGRVALRIIEERLKLSQSKLEIVAINDLASTDEMAYALKYDSVHGRFRGEIGVENTNLIVNKKAIKTSSHKDPSLCNWRDLGIDLVLESSGIFLTREKASLHLNAGAKKVLLSAPALDKPDATICYGVNNQDYRPDMKIISTASCTTNCIAPVAKILHDNLYIKKALVTTVHSYTNDQKILDMHHKDKRRSRAAALSMIPTTTGAAKAISLVMPELEGKFQGMAIRVPTPNVSLIDMVCQVEKTTSVDSLNKLLRESAETKFKNILSYCDEPIVSVDILGTNCSSIVDSLCTQVIDGDLLKIIAWYDNEWGFANRAVDLLELMSA